jgi:hypothetical protein
MFKKHTKLSTLFSHFLCYNLHDIKRFHVFQNKCGKSVQCTQTQMFFENKVYQQKTSKLNKTYFKSRGYTKLATSQKSLFKMTKTQQKS